MRKGYSKVTWLVFVLLVIMPLVLISYGGDTATAATTPPKTATAVKTSTPKVTPKYGGTLVLRQNLPVSLGYPAKIAAMGDLDAAPICTDTLISFDDTGKPIPWLATKWQYSSDLKSLTLTLRKNVKFHDGTDFNAAAVKTNLEISLAAKRGELASVSSVDVIDTDTVRLNLSKVDAFLIPNLAEVPGIMISPAALAKGQDWCRTNPVGTGPFKLVNYQSGVGAKFEKWDGYWQKGKPYLDAVQIVFIPNDMTALAALQKGEIQVMSTRDAAITKDVKNFKISTVAMYLALTFDSAHMDSPFSDIKVRQAIAYAIDSQALQNGYGAGYWTYSNQFVDKSSVYYNPKVIGYPYNLQKAKDVLAASRYPNGFKTYLRFGTSGNTELICTAVQAMLAKIGIEVTLQPMSPAADSQAKVDGWQSGIQTNNMGITFENEPGRYMQNWISKDAYTFQVVARSAEYDAILAKIIAETDFNKRIALNQQLLKQMVDGDCLIDYVFNNGWIFLKSPDLNGDHRGEIWNHMWLPQNAWFSK